MEIVTHDKPLIRGEPLFNPDSIYRICARQVIMNPNFYTKLFGDQTPYNPQHFIEYEVKDVAVKEGLLLYRSAYKHDHPAYMEFGISKNDDEEERKFKKEMQTSTQYPFSYIPLSQVYNIVEIGDQREWATQRLIEAIVKDDWTFFETALENGANLDPGKGRNPFILAIELGRLAMVENMLKTGIDPNELYIYGEYPIHDHSYPLNAAYHKGYRVDGEYVKNQAMIDLLKRYGAVERAESKVDDEDEAEDAED